MKKFLLALSFFALVGLTISSCGKEEDGPDNNNNNNNNNNINYSECPYKYEGEYLGEGGRRLTIFGRGTDAILLVSNGFLYDTVRASIDCSLRSYTFYSTGYGTFSEDGNTLIINYPDYLYTVTETLTKIKSSGIYLFDIEEDTIIAGESLDIPVQIRKFGDYGQQISLTVDDITNYGVSSNEVTGSFIPASGNPDFDAVLRLTANANAFNSGYTVEFSASDGANTVGDAINISLINTGCISFFAGTYELQSNWCDYMYGWSDTVTVTVESSNQIRISSLSDPLSMIVEVNCFENSVSIPRTGNGTGDELFTDQDGGFYRYSGGIDFSMHLKWVYDGYLQDECSVSFMQIP